MMYAIVSACRRGIDVQLFVSEIGDQVGVFHAQRSYYSALLEAGVHIWMYPAPYILHAKHLSIDDDVAVIGSSNMDIRSFSLDLEVSMLVRGKSFVAEIRTVEDDYRSISRELTLSEWKNEPLPGHGARWHRQAHLLIPMSSINHKTDEMGQPNGHHKRKTVPGLGPLSTGPAQTSRSSQRTPPKLTCACSTRTARRERIVLAERDAYVWHVASWWNRRGTAIWISDTRPLRSSPWQTIQSQQATSRPLCENDRRRHQLEPGAVLLRPGPPLMR